MSGQKHIFREYDVRGIVDIDFDEKWVELFGKVCGTYFLQKGNDSAVLAYDCRLSSKSFHAAISRGLTSVGIDVISVGMVPTPTFYFAVKHLNKSAGIMITASHNPSEYNGFKIWCGQTTIFGDELQYLRKMLKKSDFEHKEGLYSEHNIIPSYMDAIISRIKLQKKFKVVVDGGNGAGGLLLTKILSELGVRVVPIYCEPDGLFPNHHPDPTIEANMKSLIEAVQLENADLGIGLDGDADRLGIIDKHGRLLNGDELLSIYAMDLLQRDENALILADVKCSNRLFDDIAKRGGETLMCATGHSIMKAQMIEKNAPLAGELSGHMFFAENWYGFDDALYGAALLLQILSHIDQDLINLPEWPMAYSTREIHVSCADAIKKAVIKLAQEHFSALYPVQTIDGARITFSNGWGLVRASNTQPVLVMRFEAGSQEDLLQQQTEVEINVRAWIKELSSVS